MNQGIYSLSDTMINQLNRVDVISNNIANSNTVAFKQDNLVEGSFNYYLTKAQEKKIPVTKENLIHNTIPKIDGDYINGEIGSITQTGNKLDFALIKNETFFKIKNSQGKIVYTRDGSFKNLNGFLVTSKGEKVIDKQNNPILIEDGFENKIALVQTPFSNLDKRGDNNYIANNPKKIKEIALNDTEIVQGAIEKSNVNPVSSMVALIDAQRRLEQAQKAMTGIDDINSKLISKLGSR